MPVCLPPSLPACLPVLCVFCFSGTAYVIYTHLWSPVMSDPDVTLRDVLKMLMVVVMVVEAKGVRLVQ